MTKVILAPDAARLHSLRQRKKKGSSIWTRYDIHSKTHWELISLVGECVCQAWLVCQSPAVHHTLPCCASKQHRCPPFAVSHISNACCYHLAPTSLSPARLCVWLCVVWHLVSRAVPETPMDAWLTTVQHNAVIDCVKIGVNECVFGIIRGQTLTPLRLNTNWHFSGFYFLPFYRTLWKKNRQPVTFFDNPALMQTHSPNPRALPHI